MACLRGNSQQCCQTRFEACCAFIMGGGEEEEEETEEETMPEEQECPAATTLSERISILTSSGAVFNLRIACLSFTDLVI